MDLTGAILGEYRLGEQLGVGGMGAVYKATNAGGATVAIKIIHPHLLDNRSTLDRFMREATIGQRIRHANVVRTLGTESFEDDGRTTHALVMEYVEGQTLAAMRDELGYLPDELCRHIGREIAGALSAIHEAGAIHRDIKPSNVLLTPENDVKVMDLGVAMLVDEALRLTQTGDFLGSILYAAPEQFVPNAPIDARTDLYSLGMLLYELATGRHPFGGTPVAFAPTAERRPESGTLANPGLSPFLDELIRALLDTDPEKRPGSARAVADLLAAGESALWWTQRAGERHRDRPSKRRRLTVPRETKLYGRDTDLSALRAQFDEAAAGRGQVVLLRGDAGIGKTRLVDEFVASIDTPIHFLFGNYPPGGAATATGAFSSAFLHHFGEHELEESLRPYLSVLEPIAPAFAALLRGAPPPHGAAAFGTDGLRSAFLQVTRALAQEQPTIVFIDDLHNAPREGLALFAAIAHAIADERILLVGAVRPGAHEEWVDEIALAPQARRVIVDRLANNDLSLLLSEAFGSEELADEYAWSIARKSDCNPFFAFEIVRDLRERGEVVRSPDGSWTSSGFLKDIRVPASVRELIQHRLRHLDSSEQDLLEIAACCGDRFDPAIVAEVAGENLVATLKRFRGIERKHRLIRADGRGYVFDPHQVHEAISELLFVQLREHYHAAIGEALEARMASPQGNDAVRVCHHHLHGGKAERAVPHLPAALEHLHGTHRQQRILELGGLALASEALEPALRADILILRCLAARALGDAQTEIDDADAAIALATGLGDPVLEARARIASATSLSNVGKLEPSRLRYEEALELATGVHAREQQGAAHGGLGIIANRLGHIEQAEAHHEHARAIAEERHDRRALAAAHVNLGLCAAAEGRLEESEQHLRKAIGIATEIGDLRNRGIAHSNLGRIMFSRGDLAGALDQAEKFRDVMHTLGDRRGEVTASIVLCAIWRTWGALEEMARDLEYARRWGERTGDRWMESYAHLGLGWIAEQQEDEERALAAYRRALELRESMGMAEEIADAHAALGYVLGRAGDDEAAREHFRQAAANAKEEQGAAKIHALCALAWLDQGNLEDAARATRDALEALPLGDRIRAYAILSRAPGGAAYRDEARRWLDVLLDQVPPERRASCRDRIVLHRELRE